MTEADDGNNVLRVHTTPRVGEAETRSRAALLRLGAASAGALAGFGFLASGGARLAASATSAAQDARVLNLVLELEYLENAFFAEARSRGRLRGELRRFASVVGGHEQEHVTFLKKALGSNALAEPAFDFGDSTSDRDRFVATAIELEDLSVAAYNGQATNLTPKTLAAAARIVSVEARHAAWIRDIDGKSPAAKPTDTPLTEAQVRRAIKKTGFVK
jgi:hypothetical protein